MWLTDILPQIVSVGGLIASLIAIFISLKKTKPEIKKMNIESLKGLSEIDNLEADTVQSLLNTIRDQKRDYDKNIKDQQIKYDAIIKEQNSRYDELKSEFEAYKKSMAIQMAYLQADANKWRGWAEKLNKQLRDNDIEPVAFK
jgi:hypothetical protein